MRARITLPAAGLPALATTLALGLALTLTGCGAGTTPSGDKAGNPAASQQAGGPPTGPGSASLWTLIGQGGRTVRQLPDDDPDVSAVRKTVVLHSGVTDNRDYRSVSARTKDEFSFYSKEFAASLTAQHYGTRVAAMFRADKLATRQAKVAWYRSTVYQDRTTATVEMDSVIEFTAATPAYLKKGGFTLRTPYTQHRTVSLVKRDGTWQIAAIRKTPLTKPAPRPEGS